MNENLEKNNASNDDELEAASGGTNFFSWAWKSMAHPFSHNAFTLGKGIYNAIKDGDSLADGYMHAVDGTAYADVKSDEAIDTKNKVDQKFSDSLKKLDDYQKDHKR